MLAAALELQHRGCAPPAITAHGQPDVSPRCCAVFSASGAGHLVISVSCCSLRYGFGPNPKPESDDLDFEQGPQSYILPYPCPKPKPAPKQR